MEKTKTLPVSNSDSTNEVVRLALQQFSIIGNVKDYQLWVISRRDNTPYPLIGHEFPFSIQMSHVRQLLSQSGNKDVAPGDRQRALLVCKQCQFILKPRALETMLPQIYADVYQKSIRRRRPFMSWAFWRGSSFNLTELPLSFTGEARGCLFGQPLNTICAENSLPKPIMDMLAFLYHEGSWTRGIFRRPAGARAVRELRDSLDAGEFQLPLTRDHVFIIAGVFKDFLRSIPDSLLCSDLFEEWMDVLDEDDEEEEQVQDVQRMISRLPKENILLLRYLLAMLNGIQSNAHENQMTSFNLSVCIAPSMLWPPGAPCSPEVEGEGAKKVCELVKFMIEHCEQILQEPPSSLFGGPSQRLNSEETGSDSWQYPLADSSYDSLENALDCSSSESLSCCNRKCPKVKPLRGSLDSILTFSDDDQDPDPDQLQSQNSNTRSVVLDPQVRTRSMGLFCPSQEASRMATSSTLDSLNLDVEHRQRRCSEPAIMHVNMLWTCTSASTDILSVENRDGEKGLPTCTGNHMQSWSQNRRGGSGLHGGHLIALEASSLSFSSNPASPAQNHSSLDSLDSLIHNQTRKTKQGLHPRKEHLPPNASSSSVPSDSTSSSTGSAHGHQEMSTRGHYLKETFNWGVLKGCMGLHPNSWLKKDRRMSITQQDQLHKDKEDKLMRAPKDRLLTCGKPISEKGNQIASCQAKSKVSCSTSKKGGQRQLRGRSGKETKDSSSPPSHHTSTGKPQDSLTVKQLGNSSQSPAQAVFHKQSGPSLSLFKRQKSFSTRAAQRRGSEPGRQVLDRDSNPIRPRIPSDPGLELSDTDSQQGTSETRFCLSPHTTKAVKQYFSSQPRSGQQVALALAESHRDWLRRRTDPTAEPDLDQLRFAEGSYV
ncbi:rho GTPase-activating protein 20-like isoform X2 [Thalassophryne amazonica]|uniref:rho GTPase-activating protein 20-like isoform X2 n=1 Tax=Thalassophryne amazonica TaxID=390379 RepID=UPI001471D6A4|nr:rho GTPase-activating protein 20-like isoform X2 [Thalassophryne amazonica]